MATKDKHTSINWLPKIGLPRLGGETELKEKEVIERLQEEVRQLRSALRWSVGFIVNTALGMEVTGGAKVETAQIKQGIKEGIKKSQVPRGILTNLDDVPTLLKEWDFRTFRVEQDLEVQERTAERIVLRHTTCPKIFKTMRRSAQFLVDRVSTDLYLYLPSPLDFLCVPHTLCRSMMIGWLSDGRFEVEELSCERTGSCEGVCVFAVKLAPASVRRAGGVGKPSAT